MRVLGTGMLGLALVTAAIGPCLCPPIATLDSDSHRCCESGGPTLRASAEECCQPSTARPAVTAALGPAPASVVADHTVLVEVSSNLPRASHRAPAPLLIALRI
ncbi:MAG TPA: hypothetical protein VGN09_06770 [Vicinamibacteria bacterium]|jgi:hypothetical protein